MKSGWYLVSGPSTNASWPLNYDLCISNPLIMFILSPNPSVPRSCPSVQVSAASDLPVHHEVAFVQLWPHLLGHATLPQPFCRQDGPLLRSPWQPWLLTPRLLTSASLPPDSYPAKLQSQQSRYGTEFGGAALDTGWSCTLGQIRPWKINKGRPDDLGLLKGHIQFSLVWPCSDQQTTGSWNPPFSPSNTRQWVHLSLSL